MEKDYYMSALQVKEHGWVDRVEVLGAKTNA